MEYRDAHRALQDRFDTRADLDRMRAESTEHGWHELYADRYPHAGGEQHVALYVESSEGFEVEVVVGT